MAQSDRSNSFGSVHVIIYIAQLIVCCCINRQWAGAQHSNKYG